MFYVEDLNKIEQLKVFRNSIILPKYTKVENNEKLYYVSLGKNQVRLYSENNLNIYINQLLTTYKDKLTNKEYLKFQRILFSQLIDEQKVIEARKIKLPHFFINNINNPYVIFVNSKNHAKLFNSIDQYKTYTKKHNI